MQSNDLGTSSYEMLYCPSKNARPYFKDNNNNNSSKRLLNNKQTLSQDYEVMNNPDQKL